MSLLTRHGYIISSDDFLQSHINELTVAPIKNKFFNNREVLPFPVFEDINNGTIAVPRYWGEKEFGRAKREFGHVENTERLVFKGCLRNEVQKDAVSATIKQLSDHGGGVLSLATGIGKTVISLYVACSIKTKTLVVVHKQFLLDQWEERIKNFVPFARVGRLQQNIEDVENCDIVVGMLQSIAMREYDEYLYHDFGLVIFDEVHVVPAPVFSRALLRLCAPYMLGLSATPVRKDGLSRVIHWFIGPTFFEHSLTGKKEVSVHVVTFQLKYKLPTNMAVAINMICNMEERNKLIINKIVYLVSAGHKVILLSDRRAHCENLKCMLSVDGIEGALYMGGMKSIELEKSKEKDVLFATYSMAKEGLDIPSLNALVLATPRSDVVQACGRILHGKTLLSPVIIDVVDNWFIGVAQLKKRQLYYKKAGFTVIH